MTPEQVHICQRAVENFGRSDQFRQAQEELAELIVVINKFWTRGTVGTQEMIDEIADVSIMLYQLKEPLIYVLV